MTNHFARVGEVRPSQLLYTYGVGAIIDLPRLSVIVTGLEDWPSNPQYARPIVEDRLLTAVRFQLPTVSKLLAPPIVEDSGLPVDPFDAMARIGVPVATFPRWMVCPMCRLLAPLKSGLFKLQEAPYRPDRTGYRHENCNKGKTPDVVPARFLVACESGHLDDFPWVHFVHEGDPCDSPLLRLNEYGPSGEARDLEVRCDNCGQKRRMAEAFGNKNREQMPLCRGRRPHLRDYDPEPCTHKMRTLTLGASNTWFPVVYSTVAIPADSGRLPQLVDEHWAILQNVQDVSGVMPLREVRAMVGFTRLDAVGELTDPDLAVFVEPAPLTRLATTWTPAAEVRGEGIFIQFNERRLAEWVRQTAVNRRADEFVDAHKKWRAVRFIEPPEEGFPGMRYILIHSFAHALMRQLALECGYAAASIRERIYARPPEKEGEPMAGLLIYTAAPDSEGTLGGLVSLGQPDVLERHVAQALEAMRLCASDPLCAEHPPSREGRTLHAAACHACLFAPETSCERGNKYLDRSLLAPTVEYSDLAFFQDGP